MVEVQAHSQIKYALFRHFILSNPIDEIANEKDTHAIHFFEMNKLGISKWAL
jgi:hypothetical protein